jgi:predicted dehydrogenase
MANSPINRRQFVKGATLASAAAITTTPLRAKPSASEKVVIGVMGLSRGLSLARGFQNQPNCEVKYVCDVDTTRLNAGIKSMEKATKHTPMGVTDFRKILDDNEVDALACAAPNHWHGPATILGCKAGKHVYVEKPCSHNPHEGELMVRAAKKHKRVVQMGNQRRSWPGIIEGIQLVRGGEIGDVYYSRSWYANTRGPTGKYQAASAPKNLNYDLWQGPAARQPYQTNTVPYKWHWNWHWGNGELGNNGIHAIDLSRWGLGVDYPTRVTAGGGRYAFNDDQQTPDTHMITLDFPGKKTIIWEGLSCNRHGIEGEKGGGFGASFHGTKGTIVLSSTGYTLYTATNRVKSEKAGKGDDGLHFANFLQSIRSTGPDGPAVLPNSWIEGAHKSTLLCHLGNIAYRTGNVLNLDPSNGHIRDDSTAQALWKRQYAKGWEPVV